MPRSFEHPPLRLRRYLLRQALAFSRQCIKRKKRRHLRSAQRAVSSEETLVEWWAAFSAGGLAIPAKAAIDAVRQWRYKPYMIGGEPVEVDSRITINFTLSGA